ncbi:MAG: ROK family protein [Gammaproteobacteria bacterium]|nr:ROK family protein [Gammaproteobacteria bacterium]MCW8986653.1 ROK family protein [Gammaproteobacteria bacterium]
MRIGIDLGGTKIEGIALDDTGHELYRKRIDAPQGNYHDTLNAIIQLVADIESNTKSTGSVGIGIPGTISPATNLVKNSNSVWLINQPLRADLESLLKREVRIENDANCFVVSEATDGAAKDADIVFGVIIGTGTGGGIYVRGQSIIGANAIAGEWGHNPLPWATQDELPGRECYCGKCGCIETWLSGTGFANEHKLRNYQANNLTAKDIVLLAGQGDQYAQESLSFYQERLAKSLASIINVIDPDVIVLGGGMSNIKELYTTVPKLWDKYVFSDHVITKLVAPKHGDSSGVRGAAWLWPHSP